MAFTAALGGAAAPARCRLAAHADAACSGCCAAAAPAAGRAQSACRARDSSCAPLRARAARRPRGGGVAAAAARRVVALDAAQPFDYEALARRRVEAERAAADKLCIGARLLRVVCSLPPVVQSACRVRRAANPAWRLYQRGL
jgi:hypothetical protein